ncbi:MAG: Sec-dependent nitrous-oxide reductase [Capnocytophaga sp.]|nr:Sec-dependent nitrous-oxide reductase [Capnocytophaga sp.]
MKTSKLLTLAVAGTFVVGCGNSDNKDGKSGAIGASDAASRVYVEPGKHDEYYAFLSGGFSGQIATYGLPSGRMLKVIPVFSQDPEKGYGYNEETKPLLQTTHGFIPWDDSHHPELSQTNGEVDGRWIFINGNNTPRIARVSLKTFETEEIIELPNAGGNHSSTFVTQNTEYVVGGTRFSIPIPQEDVAIKDYKGKFKGTISFVKVNPETGRLNLEFQVMMPGFNYDLAHSGKNASHGWVFFTTYNSEEANSLLEVEASQNDKDYIAAINWKVAEEYIAKGNYTELNTPYYHNVYDEHTHMATSKVEQKVKVLDPAKCPGLVYLLPTPKSPHGVDVDPTGEYIIGNGKLSSDLTVHSFSKMEQAIKDQKFEGDKYGIPIIKMEDVVAGVVKSTGLGPLHTEFDDKGNAYTTFFISSEVIKWKVGTWEVLDRHATYYAPGHLMIPGGDSKKPFGKYLVVMNKITKDRYLPTGPELCQSAQLFDISGDKMELLLDFPTIGEPHYAQGAPASLIAPNSTKIFKLTENKHPYVTRTDADAKVVREGNNVHVYMTCIRSHFSPDNIEGIKVGDTVYFHVTNVEQDWDIPHGFSVMGAENAELLIMPGQTETLVWTPKSVGVFPFYCTDFCSALHQEMQGYVRVSAANANTPLKWSLGDSDDEL